MKTKSILVALALTLATSVQAANIDVTAVNEEGKYVHAKCTLKTDTDEQEVWSGHFTGIDHTGELVVTCRYPEMKDGIVKTVESPRSITVVMGRKIRLIK